jgi:hypothetical protein
MFETGGCYCIALFPKRAGPDLAPPDPLSPRGRDTATNRGNSVGDNRSPHELSLTVAIQSQGGTCGDQSKIKLGATTLAAPFHSHHRGLWAKPALVSPSEPGGGQGGQSQAATRERKATLSSKPPSRTVRYYLLFHFDHAVAQAQHQCRIAREKREGRSIRPGGLRHDLPSLRLCRTLAIRQGTKSLRSSPLRGGKSREALNQPKGRQ